MKETVRHIIYTRSKRENWTTIMGFMGSYKANKWSMTILCHCRLFRTRFQTIMKIKYLILICCILHSSYYIRSRCANVQSASYLVRTMDGISRKFILYKLNVLYFNNNNKYIRYILYIEISLLTSADCSVLYRPRACLQSV